ncbi:MAG: hypothetical protein KJ077_30340 [Anaerolineae bacterium]|nr:hypothetical protein [Anaerolineae bacterium]
MDNIQLRREILKLLYDAQTQSVSGTLTQEDLGRKIGVPGQDVQINLAYLADEDEKYVELSETVIGIRIYRFVKLTIAGIKLVEDVTAFNRKFPFNLGQPKRRIGYNSAVLRALLTAAFTDVTLRDLCYDRFRPAYEQFSTGMGKAEMIGRLIEYLETQDLIEEFLAAVKEANPRQYANYEAQLKIEP